MLVNLNWAPNGKWFKLNRQTCNGIVLSVFDTWLGRRLNIERWCSSILYYRNPFGIASFNARMYVGARANSLARLISLHLCLVYSRSPILIRFSIHVRTGNVCLCIPNQYYRSVNECSMHVVKMWVVKMISKCFFSVHCQIPNKMLLPPERLQTIQIFNIYK